MGFDNFLTSLMEYEVEGTEERERLFPWLLVAVDPSLNPSLRTLISVEPELFGVERFDLVARGSELRSVVVARASIKLNNRTTLL